MYGIESHLTAIPRMGGRKMSPMKTAIATAYTVYLRRLFLDLLSSLLFKSILRKL